MTGTVRYWITTAALLMMGMPAEAAGQISLARSPDAGEIGISWRLIPIQIGGRSEGPAQVVALVPCSPAHHAGLQPEDLILEVDGIETREVPPFRELEPGAAYDLVVRRGDRTFETVLVIGPPPGEDRPSAVRSGTVPPPDEMGCGNAAV